MTNSTRHILVYGATGRCGRLVAEKALSEGWVVTCFVRNPDKITEPLKSNATIFKGDLCNAESIKEAIEKFKPNAIVDASSQLPFGHAKGQPANNADRAVILKSTAEALETEGRFDDCVFLIVGGQLFAEPGGTINSFFVSSIAWVLRNLVIPTAWREAEKTIKWLFEETSPAFRFVYARMGQMVEENSKGILYPEPTLNNIQRGTASYCDVADAFFRLADDHTKTWERKAIFLNYHDS